MLPLLAILTLTAQAAAQAAPEAKATEEESSRFSVGAGVGYPFGDNTGLIGLGGASGLSASFYAAAQGRAPYGTALVEAQLSRRLRLGLGVLGSYDHVSGREDGNGERLPATTFSAWAGSVSLRWIVNPGARVEVSPLLALGGYRSAVQGVQVGSVQQEDGSFRATTASAHGQALSARLGLVLEYRLLSQLFLRLESQFVSASYGSARSVTHAPGKDPRDHVVSSGVDILFNPSLQLRFTF